MRLAARDVFGSKAEKENRNDDGGTRRAENGWNNEPKEGKMLGIIDNGTSTVSFNEITGHCS